MVQQCRELRELGWRVNGSHLDFANLTRRRHRHLFDTSVAVKDVVLQPQLGLIGLDEVLNQSNIVVMD
jgi:hypothetical protein